ncbi:18 kDa ER-associated protein [Trypanosoma brucei equiperdum]|nr:18 kDa ER-associated protein [Trypanosoma brucei equiperdum]
MCRRGLVVFGLFGVGSDYYLMHYYEAFEPSEGKLYYIDWSPIGRPRCQIHLLPNNNYPNYSPWTPRNGDVVLARSVPHEPNWIQLISGRFVERETCGVQLAVPIEEVQERQRREERGKEELKKLLGVKDATDEQL